MQKLVFGHNTEFILIIIKIHMTNIFDTLDKKKLSTKLYPEETINFLSDLLGLIGEHFDPYKKFNDQFLWKTKSQYEVMIWYILQKFANIDQLREEEWSVKFILSKVLESIIFKNLETIYFYNLYNDSEKRNIRTQLERWLDHIYQCNLLSDTYITDEEISKVVVDWVVVTVPQEIKKALQTTMKKNRYVYSVKLNEEANKIFSDENKVRSVFENLESIWLEKPLIDIFTLSETKFTTSKDFKSTYRTDKEKIASLILDEKSYYLARNWVIRPNTKSKKVIAKVDFQKLEFIDWKLYDRNLDISFWLDSKLWGVYQTLLLSWFIRLLQWDELVRKEYKLNWNYEIYEWLLNSTPNSILWVSKYGEFTEKHNIKSIEVKWRLIKNLREIYQKLEVLDTQEIFKVTFDDDTTLVVSKDLNYFFLLNLGLITKTYLWDKELSFEQVDQLWIFPKLVNWRSLQTFIATFLDYELEDYLNEYEDVKMLEIISKNFSKNDIIKYTREYKTKIDKFEETLNIAKLLPKSLHE